MCWGDRGLWLWGGLGGGVYGAHTLQFIIHNSNTALSQDSERMLRLTDCPVVMGRLLRIM